MRVVEAWVFGLLCVEMTVEGVSLLAHLRDERAMKESVEVCRVVRLRLRKHLLVDELVDGDGLHDGEC
jgi:hypothetical protein